MAPEFLPSEAGKKVSGITNERSKSPRRRAELREAGHL